MSSPSDEVMETRLSWDGDIAILTINNEARRNALSPPVRQDMMRHLEALMAERKCRGIVMHGAGAHYSAGGDVKGMKDRTARGMDFMERRINQSPDALSHRIVTALVSGPKPVVQAVEGVALGAGLAYALAGDYTVAASNARFAGSQVLRGLCPDGGFYYLLTARCGPGRARELLLSGRNFTAQEAERYGIVHQVVEPGQALQAGIEACRRFAAVPPLAFALTKAAMTHNYHTLEDCFRAEQNYQPIVGLSRDHKESVAAFLEKRKPVFNGE